MTIKNWVYTFLILIIGFGVIYFFENAQKKDLTINSSYTCGRIYYYGRSTRGGTIISYEYIVNGINYKSSDGLEFFKDCEKTRWCIGKSYEVRYSSKNPENSKINYDKKCVYTAQKTNKYQTKSKVWPFW